MDVTFTGTGTLHPSERAQTSLLLEDDPILFDCGDGVLRNIVASPVDYESIDTVLITHRHPDHVCDLVPLLLGTDDLTIYGPPHTSGLIEDILEPYPGLERDRSVGVHEIDPGETVQIGERTVDTMETLHNVPTLAYRVDDAFVYSGDTAPMAEMATFADGCELLVHECHSMDPDGGGNWHSNPYDLAPVLEGCSVEHLALVHVGELAFSDVEAVRATIEDCFDREVWLPADLETVSLEA